MQTGTPEISVVMPVYNAEAYLKEAIESVLNQTFTDFELIIINDGSTDNSPNIIESFTDERIVYLNQIANQGIVTALNIGIDASKGRYVARMDADDICLPQRFFEQYKFLEANPNVALCGTYADVINDKNIKIGSYTPLIKHDALKINQLFRNGFVHPSILARLSVVKKLKYTHHYQYAEDYFLFTQISFLYKVANIGKTLLLYRLHPENITSKKKQTIRDSEKKVIQFQLEKLFKENLTENDILLQLSLYRNELENLDVKRIENHLLRIKELNKERAIYNSHTLEMMLHNKWYEILYLTSAYKASYFFTFLNSNLFKFQYTSYKQLRRLFKKSLKHLIKPL